MLGLWKGLGPNIARNAIINAAELASYDQIKVSLLATGKDALLTQEGMCQPDVAQRPAPCVAGGRVAAAGRVRSAASRGATKMQHTS